MRPFSSSAAFVAAGAALWSCAVYDSGLVPSNDSLITTGGEGPSTSNGGKSDTAGSSSSSAGTTATGGTSGSGQAGNVSGGTNVIPEGGAGGEAPITTGGTAGSGGTGGSSGGGKAGAGGTAGAAGKGGTSGAGGTVSGGGSGGSGGSVAVVKCADHPIPLKAMWVPTASSSSLGTGVETDGLYNPPAHMTDGSYTERWSSGKPQAGDEWIQIDFGAVVNITQLTLNVQSDPGDYPRAYAVRISNTPMDFAAVVKASGAGAMGNLTINFPALITGRYLTVRQTGIDVAPDTAWWTITEVLVGCTD